MEYAKLGNTEIIVSRFCLGCMGFGDPNRGQHSWTLDESKSKEIIKYAYDNGITFFDTAIAYQSGTSEQYVGRALKEIAPRDKYVIATKFLPRTDDEIKDGVSAKKHINSMINQSLENLDLDYVDLYIYHMWDYKTSMEEIMTTLNDLVKEGKVRALGISNCFAWQLAEINNFAQKEKMAQFVSVQNHYNLIYREDEREMLPYCRMKNIATTPYSSLAAGRLSKLESKSKRRKEDSYAKFKYDSSQEADKIIIERVSEIAEELNCSMTEVSLAWLLSKVTSPVVGATKKEQIDGIVKATELDISPKQLLYLEEKYQPHNLSGVLAQNNPYSQPTKPVWNTGDQKIN